MVSETKNMTQTLSREAVKHASDFVTELMHCVLNPGDEEFFLNLRKSVEDFNKAMERPLIGPDMIAFYYDQMIDNFVAALRHYGYVSATARDYIYARETVQALCYKFDGIYRTYTGDNASQVVITNTANTRNKILCKVYTGCIPTEEEILELDNLIKICEQVVIA